MNRGVPLKIESGKVVHVPSFRQRSEKHGSAENRKNENNRTSR